VKRTPVIPLLLFGAVDLVLALILLIGDGFSVEFVLVAAIGLVLAAIGLRGFNRAPE
jgi:membrane protein implicated in regulation of membrane protease activity